MAITNVDILAPRGPVEVKMFPGENVAGDNPPTTVLEERLNEYISQAYTEIASVDFSAPDEAALNLALYFTFKAAYMVAVSRPSTEDSKVEVLGSRSFAKDQRDALLSKASEYYDKYLLMLSAVPTTASPVGAVSRSTTNVFAW